MSIILGQEESRQFGLRCRECNSPKTVYFISEPLYGVFDQGAYCYKCLLQRCRLSRCIPFPIPEDLLNSLKLDMGLQITSPPKIYGGEKQMCVKKKKSKLLGIKCHLCGQEFDNYNDKNRHMEIEHEEWCQEILARNRRSSR